jgi:three-Cys-motif partner protein
MAWNQRLGDCIPRKQHGMFATGYPGSVYYDLINVKRPANTHPQSETLFRDLPTIMPPRKFIRSSAAVWTEHKANFIQQYLKLFIQITKHGTYIDGFAGPQKLNMENAWSAKLVLQIRPPLLRHFFLCEQNVRSFKKLKECVDEMPQQKDRTIELFKGDFNEKVDEILLSQHLKEKEATFALLDQRMFECHWKTAEKLAAKKTRMKIELFYFFGFGWAKRALAGVTKNNETIKLWWGRGDYLDLKQKSMTREQISRVFVERFEKELGYKYVTPYQIFKRERNNIVMYHMLHATDHDDAPELMNRAYRRAVRYSQKAAEQLSFAERLNS